MKIKYTLKQRKLFENAKQIDKSATDLFAYIKIAQ